MVLSLDNSMGLETWDFILLLGWFDIGSCPGTGTARLGNPIVIPAINSIKPARDRPAAPMPAPAIYIILVNPTKKAAGLSLVENRNQTNKKHMQWNYGG